MRRDRGLSAAVAALAAITFLVIGLYMSIIVLQRTGQGGMAQMAGIHRAIGEEHRGLRIFIEPENDRALIRFINEWGDAIRIDYLLILDKNGRVKLRLEKDSIPPALRYMPPGRQVILRPSDLRLESKYNNYWEMKRDISRIVVHTEDGNVFASIYGRPPGEIHPIYVETTWTFTTTTTTATTTTTTSWTTTTVVTTVTTNVP